MNRGRTDSMEREHPDYDPFVTVASLSVGFVLLVLAVKFAFEGHLTSFTAGLGALGVSFVLYSWLWAKRISIVRLVFERLR